MTSIIMAPRVADEIIRKNNSNQLQCVKSLYFLPLPSSEVIFTLLIGKSDELAIVTHLRQFKIKTIAVDHPYFRVCS